MVTDEHTCIAYSETVGIVNSNLNVAMEKEKAGHLPVPPRTDHGENISFK